MFIFKLIFINMKKLAFLLVSGIFACANFATAATSKVTSLMLNTSSEDTQISQQQNEQLILEQCDTTVDQLGVHYSHSSHSSHESHYSHRSHYSSRY